MSGAIQLSKTPIHIATAPGQGAACQVLSNFNFDAASFESYIDEHCSEDAPGRLIMIETTATDWTTWECHTEGDEIVIVLSGKGDFIQQIDGHEQRIAVSTGTALVNPKGVWHTADVRSSIQAVYITPCPGTEHKPRD
jgi:mannose-6-phosphate isomerase-like protein (cupin superfamily)